MYGIHKSIIIHLQSYVASSSDIPQTYIEREYLKRSGNALAHNVPC